MPRPRPVDSTPTLRPGICMAFPHHHPTPHRPDTIDRRVRMLVTQQRPIRQRCDTRLLPGHSLVLVADLVAGDDVQAGRRPPLAARSGLDIEGATWTIPWTFEGLASTGWIRRYTSGSIPLR